MVPGIGLTCSQSFGPELRFGSSELPGSNSPEWGCRLVFSWTTCDFTVFSNRGRKVYIYHDRLWQNFGAGLRIELHASKHLFESVCPNTSTLVSSMFQRFVNGLPFNNDSRLLKCCLGLSCPSDVSRILPDPHGRFGTLLVRLLTLVS